jgi:hypothetical protein
MQEVLRLRERGGEYWLKLSDLENKLNKNGFYGQIIASVAAASQLDFSETTAVYC